MGSRSARCGIWSILRRCRRLPRCPSWVLASASAFEGIFFYHQKWVEFSPGWNSGDGKPEGTPVATWSNWNGKLFMMLFCFSGEEHDVTCVENAELHRIAISWRAAWTCSNSQRHQPSIFETREHIWAQGVEVKTVKYHELYSLYSYQISYQHFFKG